MKLLLKERQNVPDQGPPARHPLVIGATAVVIRPVQPSIGEAFE